MLETQGINSASYYLQFSPLGAVISFSYFSVKAKAIALSNNRKG